MSTFKRITASLVISAIALCSCFSFSIVATLWVGTRQFVFTIPENYEGFLAISYNCPQGTLIDESTRAFAVAFPSNGAACIENAYTGGPYRFRHVHTTNDQIIPVVLQAETATEYALIDLGFMSTQFPATAERAFTLYWVGNIKHLAMLQQNGGYQEELATFLETNYGIPQDGAQ